MKNNQLRSLIEVIVRQLVSELENGNLNEFTLSSSDINSLANNSNLDTSTPPQDAMTSNEKARMDRENEHQRQQQVKTKELELNTAKKETTFQRQKIDQEKRVTIPTLTKDLQKLKGAKI